MKQKNPNSKTSQTEQYWPKGLLFSLFAVWLSFLPEDGGSRFPITVATYLPGCITSHPYLRPLSLVRISAVNKWAVTSNVCCTVLMCYGTVLMCYSTVLLCYIAILMCYSTVLMCNSTVLMCYSTVLMCYSTGVLQYTQHNILSELWHLSKIFLDLLYICHFYVQIFC